MSMTATQTVFVSAVALATTWTFWPTAPSRPSVPVAPIPAVSAIPGPPARRIPTDAEIRAAQDQEACRRKLAQRGQVVLYISPSKQVRSAVCQGVDWFAEAGRPL